MSGRRLPGIWLLLSLGLATPAASQQTPTYTVTPLIGFYIPTSDLVSNQTLEQPATGQQLTAATFGQDAAVALGFRVARNLTPELALEIEFLYSSSDIELSGVRPGIDPVRRTSNARVIAWSAAAVFEIFRAPFTPLGIYLTGGLGLMDRGGDFFDDGGRFFGSLESGTDIGLTLGTGFRYGLSPRLSIRVDIRDYISSYSQSLAEQDIDSELQNDLWITGGLELSF